VTITFSFDAGDFERENSVADPFPVKLSTSLSDISNVGKLFANNTPQKVAFDAGAVANTITESVSNPKPLVGVAVFCGSWITLLSDICICATRVTSASVPSLYVALNFVFTPSKATFILWAVPDPTEVKLIPVPADAFDAELAI